MSTTTVDTERFCRLVCLITQTGTKVLRKLFVLYVEGQNCTVKDFFAKNKWKISRLGLFHDQRFLIFPPDKSDADLQKFDITLLSLLLNNLFNSVSHKEKQLIHDLKEFRNGLNAHKGEAMTDQDEFNRLWKEVSKTVIMLANMVNDSNFDNEIRNEIDSFLNKPLCLQGSIDVIMERFNHDVTLDLKLSEILEKLDEVIRIFKEFEHDSKVSSEDEVDSSVWEVDKKLKTIHNLNDHTSVRVRSVLKDNPVLTRQIQKAREVINKKGVVTITGNPGEGKTFAGYLLLNITSTNLERCIILHDAKDWSFVDMGKVDVLFIDDIFGKHQLDEGLLTAWSSVLSDLHSYVTEGKVKLIIALRQAVLAEFNSKRPSMFSWRTLFNNKVELSSSQLDKIEKRDILITALNKCKRDINLLNVDQCVQLFNSPIGFPYCCSLFAADERCFGRREDFFLRPYQGIRDILHSMDQSKLVILAYIFCCYDIHVDDLKCELHNSKSLLLQQLCEIFLDKQVPPYRKMQDALKELDGVYLVQDNGTYRIAHNVLYESVGLELSERCPKLVLEKCSIDFLCQCVQTGTDQTNEIFVVTDGWYKDLCLRFIAEVTEQNNASRISVHHALKEPEIRGKLIEILKETGKTVQFLRGGGNDPATSIIAYFALRNVCLNGFVKRLLEPLNTCGYILSLWKYPLIKSALWLAYAAGNKDLVDVLLRFGTKIDVSCLYASIFSRDPVLVESVLQNLKEKRRFDIHCISLSAEVACAIGCSQIFNMILSWNPKLNPHHMIAATFGGNVDTIQIVADHLRTKEGWEPLGIEFLESFGCMLKKACEDHNEVKMSLDNVLKYQGADAFARYSEMFSMAECMRHMVLENSDVRTFIDYVEIMQKSGWLKVLLEHSDLVYRSIPRLVLRFPDIYLKDLVCFLKCMKQWNPNGHPVMLASEVVIVSGKKEMFQLLVDSGMTVNERHYLRACQADREEIIRCVTRNLPSTEV